MHLFKEPIPDMTLLRARSKFARAYPVRIHSPENQERARDVREYDIAGHNYYYREDNPPYMHRAPSAIPELYVREGVLLRLIKVNDRLRRLGYELYLFDAYRPVEVQNYFHDFWVPQYLRGLHPDWDEGKIRAETRSYWAKGAPSAAMVDHFSPPPHATGGVVDLGIRKEDSDELLYMGTPFDDVTSRSHLDYFEKESQVRSLNMSEEEAMMNRRLLYALMSEAGFTPYPNEWWHYGFGDQLSALLSGAPHAVYSVLNIPQEVE